MIIKDSYTDKNGTSYKNVREVMFTKEEVVYNLGEYITQTSREVSDFFKDDSMDFNTDGFYIYKSLYDENKGLRVYRRFNEYQFNGERDEILISKLQEKQAKIKLTEFPTGVLTREGYIFGQEMPFYENYETLFNFKDNIESVSQLVEIYKKCLKILEELYKNDIYYTDVHSKNFMVNNDDIKLIDFEYGRVKFDDPSYIDVVFYRVKNMFDFINSLLGSNVKYDCPVNFEEAYENLDVMKKRLLK